MRQFKRYSRECGKTGGQNYHVGKNYGSKKSPGKLKRNPYHNPEWEAERRAEHFYNMQQGYDDYGDYEGEEDRNYGAQPNKDIGFYGHYDKVIHDQLQREDMRQRREALDFAKQHDWGQNAELKGDKIVGLEDSWSDEEGSSHTRKVSRPARISSLRKFGGY